MHRPSRSTSENLHRWSETGAQLSLWFWVLRLSVQGLRFRVLAAFQVYQLHMGEGRGVGCNIKGRSKANA